MLKIKTKIGSSKTHGIGLFADEFIPKGTTTWEFQEEFDTQISKELMESADIINRNYLLYYCYFDKKRDKFVLCSDNQRFINHTENRDKENIMSSPDKDVSLRDIEKGEELLCDYNKFDSEYFVRMRIDKSDLK